MEKSQQISSKKQQPILLGIVVDVSNSMRRNWKNRDGRKMPRIEVVKDALNTQFKKAALFGTKSPRSIDVFCLGMGFKRTMYWSDVELSYGREKRLDDEWKKTTDTGVICDLLALSEIIPSQDELTLLEREIRKKWDEYTKQLINRSVDFDESVYQELEFFVRDGIKDSATKKLKGGVVYKAFAFIARKSFFEQHEVSRNLKESMRRYVNGWVNRIAETSSNASHKYVENILQESQKLFNQDKAKYEDFIRDTITDFVSDLVDTLITLLTLGFPAKNVIDYFNEEKIFELATQIYDHLENEVKRNISVAWAIHKGTLFLSSKSIRASLDSKRIKSLTEKCIHNYSWDILEDFVRDLVVNIFTSKFKEKAKEQIPDWLGLASSREVSRTLKQVANILPDSIEGELYSKEFMFGTTPISNALKLASLRFQDKSRKNREKILVIISDGNFESNSPLITATLLKNVGVRIICCHLTSKDIMTTLLKKKPSRWPIGAKKMFEIASTVNKSDELVQDISNNGFEIPEGVKLFYQINQSDLLEDIFESILS